MDSRGVFQLDYKKLPEKIKNCFKEDSTTSIFRMKEYVKDENPGDTDEEGDEIVPLRAQDDESEVKLQEKQVVSRKCII